MARAQPGGEDSRFVANAPSYSIADFSAASLIHGHHRAPLQYVTSAAGAATHRGSTPDFASRGGTDDGLPGMLTDSDLPPAVESKLRLCEENVSLRQELASLTAKLAQLQKACVHCRAWDLLYPLCLCVCPSVRLPIFLSLFHSLSSLSLSL
eukprot:scpid97912/ scgid2206/ 